MEVLSAFTGVLHVPNLSAPEHVMAVLEDSDAFSKRDLQKIQHDLRGAKLVINLAVLSNRVFIKFKIIFIENCALQIMIGLLVSN